MRAGDSDILTEMSARASPPQLPVSRKTSYHGIRTFAPHAAHPMARFFIRRLGSRYSK